MIDEPSAKGRALNENSVFSLKFDLAPCSKSPDSKQQVQSKQMAQPPLNSQPQSPTGPISISTGSPSSLYPIIPSSWLAETVYCVLIDSRSKTYRPSVAYPQNACGAAAPAQRD